SILLAGKTPHGVICGLALARLRELGRDLPLRVCELTALELHVAEGASSLVRSAGRHRLLEVAQLLERARAARPRLGGVLATQISCGVAHVVRDLAHPIGRLFAVGLLSRGTGLTVPRLPLRLTPARLLTRGLLTFLLLAILARQVLELLAQLVLLTRQLVELALELGLAQLPARELFLFPEQLVLAACQLTNLVEGARVRILPLLGA